MLYSSLCELYLCFSSSTPPNVHHIPLKNGPINEEKNSLGQSLAGFHNTTSFLKKAKGLLLPETRFTMHAAREKLENKILIFPSYYHMKRGETRWQAVDYL